MLYIRTRYVFIFQDSNSAYTVIQDVFMRPVNNPSTSELLHAMGGALESSYCIHITALSAQFLRTRHKSCTAQMTPCLTEPIGIQFHFLPANLRLFAHMVNHKWAFCRYSQNMSKFHCLSCRSSTHCRHWFDFERSDHPEAAEISAIKHQKVQEEIAMHVDDVGALKSTGISKGRYAIYTAETKAILQNREAWLVSQLREQLIRSAYTSTEAFADAIESFQDITAHIAGISTVLELEDPVDSRRGCSCSPDIELVRISSNQQALLLCNRKVFNVRCIAFNCTACGMTTQYGFITHRKYIFIYNMYLRIEYSYHIFNTCTFMSYIQ
jgi:hypothetical protein